MQLSYDFLEIWQYSPIILTTLFTQFDFVMSTVRYQYQHHDQNTFGDPTQIRTTPLTQNAGHSDHWAIVSDNPEELTAYFRQSLETATVPAGLSSAKTCDECLLVADNTHTHIQQIFRLDDGKPVALINAYPAVNSPYGLDCTISEIIKDDNNQDAILRLVSTDGTQIYAFDKLYAINQCHYQKNQTYYVNFSAWGYNLQKSDEHEIIKVEDPDAIRYHRAFNDIVSKNGGQVPADLDAQIANWQAPSETLEPVEINLGHSCIYLYGETAGQQDEAWCQGQVLGKSETHFFDKAMTLFDVVILREPNAKPFVVRIATPTTPATQAIAVQDYIKSNIWLQAAIYGANNVGK